MALRIDEAPVLSYYIRAFVTEREEDDFFFQQDPANHDYMKASESLKKKNMSLAMIILLKFVAI